MSPLVPLLGFLSVLYGAEPLCIAVKPTSQPPSEIAHVVLAGTDVWMVAVSDTIVYVCIPQR